MSARLSPLALAALLLLAGCGGSHHNSPSAVIQAVPKITVDWPARTRAVDAPGEADVVEFELLDPTTSATVATFTGTRPTSPAASTQVVAATAAIPKGAYLLKASFRQGTSHLIATASVSVTVAFDGTVEGADGKPLAAITLDRTAVSLTVDAGQTFEPGQTKDLTTESITTNGAYATPNYGALRLQVTDGAAVLKVNDDGSLTGLAEGDATVVATLDNLTSAPVKVHVYGAPLAVTSIAVANGGLVASPTDGRLFVSLTSANAVAPLDPASGTVGASIAVGRSPSILAFSDDGSTLYVGNDGDYSVQPVDLASGTAGPAFRAIGGETLRAYGLAVAPGASGTVAVLPFPYPYTARLGVSVFDAGVARPGFSNSEVTGSLLWASPSRLLASSGSSIQELAVDASGVSLARIVTDGTYPLGTLRLAGGRVYANSGGVYDAVTLARVGGFSQVSDISPDIRNFSGPVVDIVANRAYFIEQLFGETRLHVFQLGTFAPVTDRRLTGFTPKPDGFTGGTGSLVRYSTSGLAFRDGSQVVLFDVGSL